MELSIRPRTCSRHSTSSSASVHSKLRSPGDVMTKRMLAAIEDPNMDILGHCTGRIVVGRGRPQSEFDHAAVFTACRDNDVAVEINSRPERKDPPRDLLKLAVDIGCRFSIDTDAHAPGQLEWQYIGCDRAVECGVTEDRVINTSPAEIVELERVAPLGPMWSRWGPGRPSGPSNWSPMTTVQIRMVHELTKPLRT